MHIQAFFDQGTATVTYAVNDPATQRCAIIDPVLDFDPQTGVTSTKSADQLIDCVEKSGLTVEWLLETHIQDQKNKKTMFYEVRNPAGGSSKSIEFIGRKIWRAERDKSGYWKINVKMG